MSSDGEMQVGKPHKARKKGNDPDCKVPSVGEWSGSWGAGCRPHIKSLMCEQVWASDTFTFKKSMGCQNRKHP